MLQVLSSITNSENLGTGHRDHPPAPGDLINSITLTDPGAILLTQTLLDQLITNQP